jgi:hypothetical protein
MRIDLKSIEPNLKIACHGPALSGNTANLGNIHTSVDPRLPGELVSLDSQEDRTLFVDSLHLEAGLIRGLDPKSSLCVVPGQVISTARGQFVQRWGKEDGVNGLPPRATGRGVVRWAAREWSLATNHDTMVRQQQVVTRHAGQGAFLSALAACDAHGSDAPGCEGGCR